MRLLRRTADGHHRGLRRPAPRSVAALAVPVVAATLAVVHPGVPVQQVDLHDGAVWLTNSSALMLGRYNAQVEELNAGLSATSPDLDVLQDGSDVVLTEPGLLAAVDPAGVALAARAAVPFDAVASLAGGTVAVTVPGSGDVWARPVGALGLIATDGEADVELGPGGRAVVADDGTVLAVSADGVVRRARVADDGVAAVEEGTIGGSGALDQLTAVGGRAVGLTGTTVRTPGGEVPVGAYGADPVLQQPGPAADHVLVATTSALLEVPLSGGEPRVHRTGGPGGAPSAPVVVGRCGHGAWAAATGNYLRLCDGEDPVAMDLGDVSAADRLVFRVNRDVVVLNDVLQGRLWLPLEDPDVREPDWTEVRPQQEADDSEDQADTYEAQQNLRSECTAESAPPSAVDDDFGVRAGRTTVLPVIDNDASSECGILAISEHDDLPEDFGTLVPIHGGRALQLTTAPDADGSVEFTYTVSDGRGSTAPSTATVTLTVRDPGLNDAPEQVREGVLVVEQGATATYHALADFRDPDGDHLLLTGAAVAAGGTVRTRQDGELTFESDGSTLGRTTVRLLVSDGTETVEGTLAVDVRPAGSVPPVIDPVHVVTYVDQPVLVEPLKSVRSVSREPARLAGVDEQAGVTLDVDLGAGTFTFTAPSTGTYYVTFLVAAPPQQATGLVRIDVRERPEEVPPPTAVLDVALLPPGGEVTIDPLANDVDPAGGLLVVQSVQAPPGSGLQVAVLKHHLVRITSTRTLTEPVVLHYQVSNGVADAVGEILVQPIPAAGGQQPPVVRPVEATVRTGGIVTIPVLEHAYDPDGDDLELVPELAEPPRSGQGLMFVSGDVLRFQAPSSPMQVHATFVVRDSAGNESSSTVTVTVHASDADSKSPPRPRPLTARVFEGGTVRVEVPLVGIDADGDGVSFLGVDRAPTKGRVIEVGADWFEYEALPGEFGTDTFTYAVEDWVGQRSVATVTVGIAPRPSDAAQVVSRNDDVTVRPGQTVEVRVLANDVDTGGGELTLDEELIHTEDVTARVEGRRVVVETPDRPTVVNITYTARNTRGGVGRATLTVTVADDAPILPPIAEDVVVPARDTINRTSVEVDVLELAQNPSGPLSDLEVSVHPSAAEVATVTPDGSIVVTLVETAQTLPYVLTNTHPAADGAHTYAFITVPALGDFPPTVRPGARELRVVAGERLEIRLKDYVRVAPGRTAVIADAGSVTATKSDGSALFVDAETLQYTAQRDYAGPASITFAVTDREAQDTTYRRTVLTLPITVLAAEDHPPTFTPSLLELGPGEETRVDLVGFTSAPVEDSSGEPAGYTYRVASEVPPGFTVTLDGSVLTVAAAPTVPRGTVGGVRVAIGYGAGSSVDGQVDFRVTASSRQLARVQDHEIPDAVEGAPRTVDVLAGASNPFPGEPLTVLDAVVETPGAGTAGVAGSQVTVQPADGFIGQMVTRYRVRDVTGDPDREVEGRIVLTVRGRPDAPTAPRVREVRDRTVVLAWDAPANRGEPITSYEVTAQPGGTRTRCATTTCTLENLTNDVEYTFTVTATNAVGTSDASPPSAPARPDAKPFAPAAPRLDWGAGSVTARWDPPENPGSSITEYQLEISPAPPSGSSSATTSSTSYVFEGLANGTAYTVRVRALNRAPDPGDWSAMSAAVVPAAPPSAPAPSAQRYNQGIFGGGRIEFSWDDPAANGDAVSEYQVRVDGGTAHAPSQRNKHVIDPARAGRYTFEVRARNKAGWGPWSSVLAVEHATVPSTIGALAAEPDGAGVVRLTFADPDWAGGGSRRVEVSVDGGGFTELAADRRVRNLSAGRHSFTVRGCNSEGCGSASPTASAQVTTPPGDPTAAGVPIAFDDDASPTTFRGAWGAPNDTGGLPVTYTWRYRTGSSSLFGIDWSRWSAWTTTSDTRTGDLELPRQVRDRGGAVEIEVRAANAQGAGPGTARWDRTVPAPPPEPEQSDPGDPGDGEPGGDGG